MMRGNLRLFWITHDFFVYSFTHSSSNFLHSLCTPQRSIQHATDYRCKIIAYLTQWNLMISNLRIFWFTRAYLLHCYVHSFTHSLAHSVIPSPSVFLPSLCITKCNIQHAADCCYINDACQHSETSRGGSKTYFVLPTLILFNHSFIIHQDS